MIVYLRFTFTGLTVLLIAIVIIADHDTVTGAATGTATGTGTAAGDLSGWCAPAEPGEECT